MTEIIKNGNVINSMEDNKFLCPIVAFIRYKNSLNGNSSEFSSNNCFTIINITITEKTIIAFKIVSKFNI